MFSKQLFISILHILNFSNTVVIAVKLFLSVFLIDHICQHSSSGSDNNDETDDYADNDDNDINYDANDDGAIYATGSNDQHSDRNCVSAHDSRRSTTAPDRDVQISAHTSSTSFVPYHNTNDDDDSNDQQPYYHHHQGSSSSQHQSAAQFASSTATSPPQQHHHHQQQQQSPFAIAVELNGGNSAKAEHDREYDDDRNNDSDNDSRGKSSQTVRVAGHASNSCTSAFAESIPVALAAAVYAERPLNSTTTLPSSLSSSTTARAQTTTSSSAGALSIKMLDTNNESLPKQQLPLNASAIRPAKPDKPAKPPKTGGFLSRLTGFRFSLRGGSSSSNNSNKKSAQQTATDNNNKNSAAKPSKSAAGKSQAATAGTSADYVYIPLKEPLHPQQQQHSHSTPDYSDSSNKSIHSAASATSVTNTTASLQSSPNASMVFRAGGADGLQTAGYIVTSTPQSAGGAQHHHQHVTTKPPLPKFPPRIVGVSAKQTTPPHNSSGSSASPSPCSSHSSTHQRGAGAAHAHHQSQQQQHQSQQRAVSVPREINDYDSDYYDESSRGYDGANNTTATNTNNRTNSNSSSPYADSTANSGSSGGGGGGYYQRKRSGGYRLNMSSATSTGVGRGGVGGDVVDDNGHHIIGLIETNLDTHETVISGKTRSLMELGPQQHHHHHQHQQRDGNVGGTGGNAGSGQRSSTGQSGIDGVGSSSNSIMLEPRRPHKSMEFLLDKENQRNVQVSGVIMPECFVRNCNYESVCVYNNRCNETEGCVCVNAFCLVHSNVRAERRRRRRHKTAHKHKHQYAPHAPFAINTFQ